MRYALWLELYAMIRCVFSWFCRFTLPLWLWCSASRSFFLQSACSCFGTTSKVRQRSLVLIFCILAKTHYGNMSWLHGNHLDKRYMTVVPWGLGNLVLINHGGNKLIYNCFCQAVHRNVCCFLECDFTWILFRFCLCGFYSFILGRLVHRVVNLLWFNMVISSFVYMMCLCVYEGYNL